MTRRIILGFAAIAPLFVVLLWSRSPFGAIALLALSHALVLYPTLSPNVQWLGPVITRFVPDGKEVWLTIDDGPCADTREIVEILRQRGVLATFFVVGREARENPALIEELRRAGHQVANHSQSHPSGSFWRLTPSRIRAEVEGCGEVLRELGVPAMLFRAPVGMKNPFVHPILTEHGLLLMGWSVRGFDGVGSAPPETIVARIVQRVREGSILVVHQGRPSSPAIIAALVDELQRSGYSFVVPDAARLKTNR